MNLRDLREIVENIIFLIQARDLPKLKNFIVDIHPSDLADITRELSGEERTFFFNLLPPEMASDVLAEIDEVTREDLIGDLAEERLSEIVDEMDSDDATDIVAELPDDLKNKVLAEIESKDRAEVEKLIRYDEETAGGIMALEFVAVYDDETVDDAIQEIRSKSQEVEQVFNVYAIDHGGRLVGVVPLKKLILSNPKTTIRQLMNQDVISVTVEKDQEYVVNIVRKYDLVSVPVVDDYGRLVGRITHDDIVDVLQEEANEDLDRMAGIAEEEVLQEMSTVRISRRRLPWLLIALAGQLTAAFILSNFEATIRQITAVVFFIPVIMAMGGNAGIQSSTIIVRSIALAEGGASSGLQRFFRELRVAALNGLVITLVTLPIVLLWLRQIEFGVILGVAMLLVIINAAAIGAVVPYVLHRLNYDPAIATGPFITTSNDIFGLFIYLGLATFYLKWFQ